MPVQSAARRPLYLLPILAVAVLLAAGRGLCAMPTAGTDLANTATVTYVDEGGAEATVLSNTVHIIVQPLEALDLSADRSASCQPGQPVVFSHRLRNTGNTESRCRLTVANGNGDGFDLEALSVVWDQNGNGHADPGEPALLPDDELALAMGEAVDLVVTGVVPAGIPLGLTGRVVLTAATAAQGATAANTDTVRSAAAVALGVTKALDAGDVRPGGSLRFAITAANSGYATPAGVPIFVDDLPRSLIVLRDIVPANATLAALEGPGTGLALYHLAGEPGGRYHSAPPADLSAVDSVAYGLPELRAAITVFLTVTIHANASGQLRNTVVLSGRHPISGDELAVWSNEVAVGLPKLPPAVRFCYDNGYAAPAQVTGVGVPLYIAAEAAASNRDPLVRETVGIDVSSALTGDIEHCVGLETGPNTGVFWVAPQETADAGAHAVLPGNGTLETVRNDRLTATIVDAAGQTAAAVISVDPYGVVFDSRLDGPVEGARVTLIDVTGAGNGGFPGGPARIFDYDGVTPAPSTITTGPDGIFVFPWVHAGRYRLAVEPPLGFSFPSSIPPVDQPDGRRIEPVISYGGEFDLTGPRSSVGWDLPVDGLPPSGLFVEKKAGRGRVQPGDVLDYSVTVRNTTGIALNGVTLEDELPLGFTYLPGSAALDGAPLAEPAHAPNGRLTFALGAMAAGRASVLAYRVRVGHEAPWGDGLNEAWARGVSIYGVSTSNRAVAAVAVDAGVFTDRAVIAGKIYHDRDRNRRQDEEDIGIPGVRLYLEDGSFAVTDSEGKYSLYGARPGLHVLKVDMTTLPAGAILIGLSTREAGVTGSCFVPVLGGELIRVDFAEGSGRPDVLERIKARRAKGEVFGAEIEAGAGRALDASGEGGGGKRADGSMGGTAGPRVNIYNDDTAIPLAPGRAVWRAPAQPDLAQLAQELTNELGFISPGDGEIMPYTQINVRIKGMLGAVLRLVVNGVEVLDDRVGLRCFVPEKQLEAREYIGVELRPGENVLELLQRDDFGNLRGRVKMVVTAPGKLGRIVLTGPAAAQPADGRTQVRLEVELTDELGIPVTVQTPLTLEASLGRWLVEDLDPGEPGTQIFVAGGRAVLFLQAPDERGLGAIRVSSGALASEAEVFFAPYLRQAVAAGFTELRWRPDAPTPLTLDGGLFFQGGVLGSLLTVSYDPDRAAEAALFRDLRPDDLYPVYGDSSWRGSEAQSTSPLHLQLERGQSYLRYGDFTTGEDRGSTITLSAYNRALSGAKLFLAGKYGLVEGFVSKSRQRQVVEEIPANGTSGPYRLGKAPCVANGERVEVVTRDRDHPALIIKSMPQQRFLDYELDPLRGEILFRRPLPSLDPDLNPVWIRVTYETAGVGEPYLVLGGTGRLNLGDRAALHGTWVRNEDPAAGTEIYGLGLAWRPADRTNVALELAMSDTATQGIGYAAKLEAAAAGQAGEAKLVLVQTTAAFANPSSPWGGGRLEANLELKLRLPANFGLAAKAFYSQDTIDADTRTGLRLEGAAPLGRALRLELGLGHVTETTVSGGAPATDELTDLRAKLSLRMPSYPETLLYTEGTADLLDPSGAELAVGGEYRLKHGGRFYARHELLRADPSQNGGQPVTVLGVESARNGAGNIYGEYRARDAFAEEAELALGLRHQWTVAPGWRLHLGFERLAAISPTDPHDNTALTLAGEYTGSPVLKASSRLEFRAGYDGYELLNTAGAAWKIDRDWTFLGRNQLTVREPRGGEQDLMEHLQLGLAFRQTDLNHWNALGKYDFVYERNGAAGDPGRRQAHSLSVNVNYQPVRAVTLGLRYAGRFVTDYTDRADSNAVHLLRGSYAWDATDRWHITLWTQGAWSTATGTAASFGTEAGYLLWANLWLCAGYMPPDDPGVYLNGDRAGFQLTLRFKFDEELFKFPA